MGLLTFPRRRPRRRSAKKMCAHSSVSSRNHSAAVSSKPSAAVRKNLVNLVNKLQVIVLVAPQAGRLLELMAAVELERWAG